MSRYNDRILMAEPEASDDAPRPLTRAEQTVAGEVTELLHELGLGAPDAVDALVPLVYRELRRLAASALRVERPGHTLNPTALVHEAYIKLLGQHRTRWQNRAHFFAVAARVMRRILVDHARRRGAQKRGAGTIPRGLEDLTGAREEDPETLLALHLALDRLEEVGARPAQIVELRYFGGMSTDEIAELLGVSARTVGRDWRFARAWLRRELGPA